MTPQNADSLRQQLFENVIHHVKGEDCRLDSGAIDQIIAVFEVDRAALCAKLLEAIGRDNYAPTGSQYTVEAVNRERKKLRKAVEAIFNGKEKDDE